MNSLALKAIADPTRQQILRLAKDKPISVGEIAEHFSSTQQAISQHLKILKDAGLLESRREGTRHLYIVRTEGFEPIAEFLEQFWPQRLQKLKVAVQSKGKNK